MLLRESAVRHALIIRFSHAQYDGLSLPVLCHDLVTAYKGQMISNPKGFPQYLKQRKLLWTEEASSFWARTLKDASMTYLPSGHKLGNGSVDKAILRIKKRLSLLPRPIGITIATLVKAAWSLVLMQITGQTDVVFGQLVSGRSSSRIDAEKVVGPCVNIVPVRVRHQADGRLLTFLQMVQQQHVDSIEFESASFQDIVANCTDWSGTTFGSVLHHVDIGEKLQYSMDHIECTGRIFSELSIPDDLWITSTLRHFDLEIDLLTSNWNLSPALAEDVVLKLCDAIHTICSNPEKPVCEVFATQEGDSTDTAES
jgi:Condensation domain